MKSLLSFNSAVISAVLCLAMVLVGISRMQSGTDSTEDQIRRCDSLREKVITERFGVKFPNFEHITLLAVRQARTDCRAAQRRHPENEFYNFAYGFGDVDLKGFKNLKYMRKSYRQGYFPSLVLICIISMISDIEEKPISKNCAPFYSHENPDIRAYYASRLAKTGNNLPFALRILRRGTAEGHLESTAQLMNIYLNKWVVGKEKQQLAKQMKTYMQLLKQAAEAGHPVGLRAYGLCLLHSKDIEAADICKGDINMGLQMLFNAAEKGDRKAKSKLTSFRNFKYFDYNWREIDMVLQAKIINRY